MFLVQFFLNKYKEYNVNLIKQTTSLGFSKAKKRHRKE